MNRKMRKLKKKISKILEWFEFTIFILFLGLIIVAGKSLGMIFSHRELHEIGDSFEPDYDFINRDIR